MNNPYACEFCSYGTATCDCCGSDIDCEECEGTGLNDDLIDVEAFNNACDAAFVSVPSWAWIENKAWLGRASNTVKVAYEDFKRVKA